MFNLLKSVIVILCAIQLCSAIPKKYDESGSNTYPENSWRRSYNNDNANNNVNDTAGSSSNDRIQRLGYTTGYGNTGIQSGYPGSGVGVYSPMKLDLGGVVLGTLVGIGALLILPKLVSAFTGGYGGHYRSADNDVTGVTEMLAKLDDFLGQNNIDSAACMQRTVCSYVRSSDYHMQVGTADQIDQVIHTLSGNSLVEYMLDGTAIKEALEAGKDNNGRDCDLLYPGCPLDKQTTMQLLNKLLPNRNMNGQQ